MKLIHQASCLAIGSRAILIEGPPGSGKSSLTLALIDRGAGLIGDDGVTLTTRNGRLIASPPPHIAGLIEVRNVGLIRRPTTGDLPVALAIRLDEAAPRHLDRPETLVIAGIGLPLIRLWPQSPVLALRAEAALELHGLSFPA